METVPNPTELHIIGIKNENSHTQLTLTGIGPIERKRTRTLILLTPPPHAANLERYHGWWYWMPVRHQEEPEWLHYPYPAHARNHPNVQPMSFPSNAQAWILTLKSPVNPIYLLKVLCDHLIHNRSKREIGYWMKTIQYVGVQQWLLEEGANQCLLKGQNNSDSRKSSPMLESNSMSSSGSLS